MLISRRTLAAFAGVALTACSSAKPAEQPSAAPKPEATPATSQAGHDHIDMPGMPATQHVMRDMPDMKDVPAMAGMNFPVRIPNGAIYTETDVRFMQGMIAHHAQ